MASMKFFLLRITLSIIMMAWCRDFRNLMTGSLTCLGEIPSIEVLLPDTASHKASSSIAHR